MKEERQQGHEPEQGQEQGQGQLQGQQVDTERNMYRNSNMMHANQMQGSMSGMNQMYGNMSGMNQMQGNMSGMNQMQGSMSGMNQMQGNMSGMNQMQGNMSNMNQMYGNNMSMNQMQDNTLYMDKVPANTGYMQQPVQNMRAYGVRDTSNSSINKIKENFHIFGIASLIYAFLFAFCMYDNPSGITYVLFTVGSVLYIWFVLKNLELKLKKGSIFYIASMILVSISTFCTDDSRIIIFNNLGMLLLVICLLLDVVYDTKQWGLGKFISSIMSVCLLSIGELNSPFEHAAWYIKNKWSKRNSKYIYLLIGIGITIPLFFVVFLLLSSADAVFRDFADNMMEGFSFGSIIWFSFMIGFMFLASYCVMTFISKKSIDEEVYDTPKYESLIAIPVATVLTILYIVFSVIQIMYLFVGDMDLPEGYTYAEYAREGFFQLLVVGILNLILVLVGLYFFKTSKALKGILVVMSFCTIIMIASSAMRMLIYIQYYYLTFLRILVLWSLLVLLLIFAGVISFIFYKKFPLFRYSMVVVTVLYLCLAFCHPDYIIAKVNLAGTEKSDSEFFKGDGYDDYYMLSKLCADAAPVIVEWMEKEGFVYDESICKEEDVMSNKAYRCASYYISSTRASTENMGIRTLNMSRAIAKACMNNVIE